MQSPCPYTHVSYSTWRSQVLRKLSAGSLKPEQPRLPFLSPQFGHGSHEHARNFHTSEVHKRKYIKDLKRTAKHKVLQLELLENTPHDHGSTAQNGKRTIPSRSGKKADWNPYSENSVEELQNLVADLRAMAKEAANEGDGVEHENIPFESGSEKYVRKNPRQPHSPLERKMRWDRDKKLQNHEVDVDKRLQENVWARILASPLRLDKSLRARLPKDLMLSFGIMRNPKDEKDYLLPVELSDLEAFRKELQPSTETEKASITGGEKPATNPPSLQPRRGSRIPLQSSKIAIEAMTDTFTYIKPGKRHDPPEISIHSSKVVTGLVPYRWRHRQGEMDAFQRTRKNFNEVLGREPDHDEPDAAEQAKFGKLGWQPDIAQRLERILNERVLIVLEALGRDNTAGRAIRHRNVLALAVPENGRFFSDEKGRITPDEGLSSTGDRSEKIGKQEHAPMVDWMYGAICIHIGSSAQFGTAIHPWEQLLSTRVDPDPASLGNVASQTLLPPTIAINDTTRLPVFNLEALLTKDHTRRLTRLIRESKILRLDYWHERNKTQTTLQSTRDVPTDINTKSDSASPHHDPITPASALDAGAQVLTSLITPKLNSTTNETKPLTESRVPVPQPSTEDMVADVEISPTEAPQEPYLILIKPQAKHSSVLIREIWQLWRYVGGRRCLNIEQ